MPPRTSGNCGISRSQSQSLQSWPVESGVSKIVPPTFCSGNTRGLHLAANPSFLVVPSSAGVVTTLLQFNEPMPLVFGCKMKAAAGEGQDTTTVFVAVRVMVSRFVAFR